MWFGHLFKVFRSVSLDLTGYVASEGHLKLVNLFVEKQAMLPATLPDIEIYFCQNNLVQGTEITINMNCRFDSFEPKTSCCRKKYLCP